MPPKTKLAAPTRKRPDCAETGRISRGRPRCQALRPWRTWSQVCAPPNMLTPGPGATEGGSGGSSRLARACSAPLGGAVGGTHHVSLHHHSILRGAAATKPERVAGGGAASRHWRRAKMGLAHASGGKGRAAARGRERDGRSRGPGGDIVQFEQRPDPPRVGMNPPCQASPPLHTTLDCAFCAG